MRQDKSNDKQIVLTPEQFLEIWRNGYKGLKEEDDKGYWEDSDDNNESIAVFNNILINKAIIIDNQELPDLRLKNSITKSFFIKRSKLGNFTISNSTLGSFSINYESIIKNFQLTNESKIERLSLNNKSTIGDFEIFNESIMGNFDIDNASKTNDFFIMHQSTAGNFRIHNKSYTGSFYIDHSNTGNFTILYESKVNDIDIITSKVDTINVAFGSTIEDFRINSRTIAQGLSIHNSKIKKFSVSKSKIGDLVFHESEVSEILVLQSDTGEIILDKNVIKRHLKISADSKIWTIKVQGKDIRKILMQDSYIQIFNWEQDTFCMVNIENCQIESFLLEQAVIPKDSVFQVSRTSINQIKFSLFTNTAWFSISALRPLRNHTRFTEKNNRPIFEEGKYLFEELNRRSSIHLINSDMGKTSFIDCNLNIFDDFFYYNTKLLEVFIGGTQLPLKITIPFKLNSETNEQQRLAFGQFKKIYDNRGDNVSANEFLALELNAYTAQLKERKIKHGEQFNLFLNKFSSNYGNDWVRSVIITLSINSICFLIYCLILGYRIGSDWGLFIKLCGYSFEFLNPLRKADFLNSHFKLPDWRIGVGVFWDYMSRIIIAYFVYQTIQAFRRFGKSK